MIGFSEGGDIAPDICKALRQSIETTLLLRTKLGLGEKDLADLFSAARWIKENFSGTEDENGIVALWYKRIGKLEKASKEKS